MSELPQEVAVTPLAVSTLSAEEMALLDRFAGSAMQTLLRIGTSEIREHKGYNGDPFDYPDQPFYFGDWDASPDSNCWGGMDSLAIDAYCVAQAMLKERRRLLEDSRP